jgi:hypothetical protein
MILFSQDKKEGLEGVKKNAVSFNFLGTSPIVGITYERILSEFVSLELGVGMPGFGAGVKIMPFKIKASTMMFTTGLMITYADYKEGFIASGKRVQLYVPIGIGYYGRKGFNFGIDVGPAYRMYNNDSNSINKDDGFIPWAGIKIGQRFN